MLEYEIVNWTLAAHIVISKQSTLDIQVSSNDKSFSLQSLKQDVEEFSYLPFWCVWSNVDVYNDCVVFEPYGLVQEIVAKLLKLGR